MVGLVLYLDLEVGFIFGEIVDDITSLLKDVLEGEVSALVKFSDVLPKVS